MGEPESLKDSPYIKPNINFINEKKNINFLIFNQSINHLMGSDPNTAPLQLSAVIALSACKIKRANK